METSQFMVQLDVKITLFLKEKINPLTLSRLKSILVFFGIGIFLFFSVFIIKAEAADLDRDLQVTVPILLYHNISNDDSASNRYVVDVSDFKKQMEQLRKWGYSSITIKDLIDHISYGKPLPARPVVISFDDGYIEVFTTAFPIMEKLGFRGTVYIVANRLSADGFLTIEELQELIDQDWEVGSHGMTHTELTQNHNLVRNEILQSRLDLENALGVKIYSFAYPFGALDWYVSNKVYDYGYQAAVGVGTLSDHSFGTIYNLSRREVQGDYSLETFSGLLPWTNYAPEPVRKYKPE